MFAQHSSSNIIGRTLLVTTLAAAAAATAHAQFSFDTAVDYFVGTAPGGMAAADFDGDQITDLATTVDGPERIQILLGDGTGQFTLGPGSVLPNSSSPQDLVAGDFDGDTDLDLAVTSHDDRTVGLYTNTGGVFSPSGTLSVGALVRPDGITAADVDDDLDIDLAVATSDQTLNINQATIFTSNGGAFNGPVNYATGGMNTSGITAADFDCDGLIDLATSNQDSNNVSLLRNTGGGAFGAPMLVAVGSNPEEIVWADLDGDEDADLAVANRNSNDISVLVNQTCEIVVIPGDVNGDGFVNTTDLLELLASWGTCGGCPADLNGDGFVNTADLLTLLANWTG